MGAVKQTDQWRRCAYQRALISIETTVGGRVTATTGVALLSCRRDVCGVGGGGCLWLPCSCVCLG